MMRQGQSDSPGLGDKHLTRRHRSALVAALACASLLAGDPRGRGRGNARRSQELARRDGQSRGQGREARRKEGGNGQVQETTNRPPTRPWCRRSRWRRGRRRRPPTPRSRWSRARSTACAAAAPARRPASRPPSRTRRRASSSNGSSCAATTTAPAARAISPSSPPIRAGRASRCSAAAPRRCSGSRISSRRKR